MRKFKVLKHKTKEDTYGDFVILKDEEVLAETRTPMLFPETSDINAMGRCVSEADCRKLDEFEMIEVEMSLPEAPIVTYRQDS